jgi:hypothetical protein
MAVMPSSTLSSGVVFELLDRFPHSLDPVFQDV